MNEVLKAIEERSSTRGYTKEKLTDEELRIILTAGLQAPTARNEQEVHISVLEGDGTVAKEIEEERRAQLLADADEEQKEKIRNNPANFSKAAQFPENYEFAIAVALGHKNVKKEPHKIDFDKSVTYIRN